MCPRLERPHEIERWIDGGESTLWVRVPRVGPLANNIVYLYSENAAASDLQDPAATFAGYRVAPVGAA